jgi:hypothetical protein
MNRDTRRFKVNNLPYVMHFIVKFRSDMLIYRKFSNDNSSRCPARSQIILTVFPPHAVKSAEPAQTRPSDGDFKSSRDLYGNSTAAER